MLNRTFKKIAMVCTTIAMLGYAQNNNKTILYSGAEDSGYMNDFTRSFPEAPEWKANWGNFTNMEAPYIRLSGQKNTTGNWIGTLHFSKASNGFLKEISLCVRSTQNVKFGVWLEGSSNNPFMQNLNANQTYVLNIPIEKLTKNTIQSINSLGIGLFDVKAYQYTTLFIDNIIVTTSNSQNIQNETQNLSNIISYEFLGGNAKEAYRKTLWEESPLQEASKRYNTNEQKELKSKAKNLFVLNPEEHEQILTFLENDSIPPKKSREGWYKALFFVNRNRLSDSIIANPKKLFNDANNISAIYEMQKFPILIANLDYDYIICMDTLCKNTDLESYHLLMAGLPSSYTNASKIQIAYDPFFVTTTYNDLPKIEICVLEKCQSLEPNNTIDIEFQSAGIQKIIIKLSHGNTNTKQTLFMEVK